MIEVKNLTKTYTNGKVETHVLRGIDLDVVDGEFLAIMGKSGAGKSTLMYQISLLDKPTSGSIKIAGTRADGMTDRERTDFRLQKLGYIFQDYALVPDLSAAENVMIPLMMMGMSNADAEKRAEETLEAVGLGHRYDNRPGQLSGGEQQRVSIARAVAQNPTILFADEPTANLDSVSSEAVLAELVKLHKNGQTIVMVTHEKEYTRECDRILYMEDGLIVSEEKLK